LSIPPNINPIVWGGNKRLPQFANITCVDDDSVESLVDDQDENAPNYNEVDGKVANDIDSMMKNLSVQGCTPKQQEKYVSKYIKSFKSEASKRRRDRKKKERERLAAEVKAREEEEKRERLAAEAREKEECKRLTAPWEEAYNKQASKAAAESKEAEERNRLAAEAEKEAEERERLAAEEEENERERLKAEVKKVEEERLAVEAKDGDEHERSKASTDSDDPDDDDMSIDSDFTSDDIKLEELEDDLGQAIGQLQLPNDDRIVELFASALTKLDSMYERKDMSKELTLCVQDIYKRSCSKEDDCSAKENGRKISEALGGGYSGELRNAKEIVLTGRTSKRSQSQLRAGRQQGAVEIVCLDLLLDGNKLGNNVQVYPRFLLEIGEDRRKPHECLAFMEVIKAVHFSDCEEVEVWTKSTLRVALFSKDFRYFVVSLLT